MTFQPDELQVLGLSAPIVLKMLKGKEDQILARIYGEFRNGKDEHRIAIAEFACVRSIINDIQSALNQHHKVEGAKHADADRKRTSDR